MGSIEGWTFGIIETNPLTILIPWNGAFTWFLVLLAVLTVALLVKFLLSLIPGF